MVEVVVQDGDDRRSEGELLGKWFGVIKTKNDGGDAVLELNFGGGFFRSLRAPVVADGRAVRLKSQMSADFGPVTARRVNVGAPLGDPAIATRANFKFLSSD